MGPGSRLAAKLAAWLLAGCALGGGCTRCQTAPGPSDALAVVGGTVIDPRDGTARADRTILIEGDRIVAVGPRDDVDVPEGAEVVDARGRWVVPGLVDAHVHFFQSGGPYTRPDVIDRRDRMSYAAEVARTRGRLDRTLRRWLATGVTAVADLGGPLWTLRLRARARGMDLAPHVAAAGRLVATVARPRLDLGDPPIVRARDPAHAARLARQQLDHGADFVKFWFIHRPGDDLEAQTDLLRAMVEVADARGAPVVVHATRLEVAEAALRAGADILAHSVRDAPVGETFLRLARDRDAVYVPTLFVDVGYDLALSGHFEPTPLERARGDEVVIDELRAMPERGEGGPFRAGAVARANLRRVHDAGITVAIGSDAGNIGTLHGPGYLREIRAVADAGLEPAAVLRAATLGGAEVMGLEDRIGLVAPGRLADLVVLDEDPLADAAHLASVHRVVRGGEVRAPDALLSSSGAR